MWTVPAEMLWMLVLVCQWGTYLWAFPSGTAPPVVECWYAGQPVVLLSDPVRVDGRDVLLYDKLNHNWTVLMTNGQERPALTSLDMQKILEECEELKKKLNEFEMSEGTSVFGLVVTLLTMLLFFSLVFLSFRYPDFGSVGGVLGSVIHYPAHFLKRQNGEPV